MQESHYVLGTYVKPDVHVIAWFLASVRAPIALETRYVDSPHHVPTLK